LIPYDALVFIMGPESKTVKHVTLKQSERAITAGDPDRPDAADFLEAKRIVVRIANSELICFSRALPYVSGQAGKMPPEFSRRRGLHPEVSPGRRRYRFRPER
jgi:hypothetical protein